MILVTGSTGSLCREISQQLLCAGFGVRVHAGEEVEGNSGALSLQKVGAEVVAGDLRRPAPRAAALDGVRQIFSLPAAGLVRMRRPEPSAGEFLLAARRAGVGRLVGLSVPDPALSPGRLAHLHRTTERWVEGFGLPAGFVHPLHHLPNLDALARYAEGRRRYPAPESGEPELVMLAPENLPTLVEAVLTEETSGAGEVYVVAGAELQPCYELADGDRYENGRNASNHAPGHAPLTARV